MSYRQTAYEPAAAGADAGRCQPGARALLDLITFLSAEVRSLGCYNPRNVAGSTSRSLHAEGRALDLYPPSPALDAWVTTLIDHHEAIGVQQVLYRGRGWRVHRGWIVSGAIGHHDHAHVELNWSAARHLTVDEISSAIFPEEHTDMTEDQARQLAQLHAVLIANRDDNVPHGRHDLSSPILSANGAALRTEALVRALAGDLSKLAQANRDAIIAAIHGVVADDMHDTAEVLADAVIEALASTEIIVRIDPKETTP